MPFLQRNEANIFYDLIESSERNSKGTNVVTLVNGHTRSSADFRILARQLSTNGIASILIDNRASGKSTVTSNFTLSDMEDDVVAVWDQIGLSSSHLLGISMGGFISQGIAARFPKRIKKLALISTASGSEWIRPTGGGWINSPNMIEEKLASYFAPGFVERNQLLFDTMVKQTKIAIAEGNFAERSDMQRDALKAKPRTWHYSSIEAETLIVHGSQDQVVDPAAAWDLQSRITTSKVVMIDGAGHLLLAEAAKKLYEIVKDWFSADQQQV